jgi:hypothetical protein
MQICTILHKVVKAEKCGPLPDELAMRIAQGSDRNLRRAMLMLEACRVQQSTFSSTQEVRTSFTHTLFPWPASLYLSCPMHVLTSAWFVLLPWLQVQVTDWEVYISKLARQITQDQTPQQVGQRQTNFCAPWH